MRNLSKLVFQRVVAVSVGILLQIGFLIVMATYLRADFFWIRIAMNVLSWAMVIYIISCGVNPSYKIAWIVLILAFPVAGLTIYLLFGGNKISSYEHRKMQSIEAVTMQQLQQEEEPLWELAAARTPAFNHARYLLSASGYPIYDDADATYFPSGESCYAAMLEELQKAEHYIFIEFFIIAQGKMWDPILQILREKAAAGVDVRVVYDDFGCITRLPMQYAKKLREMGIRAHAFNPYVPILSARLNNRDHRKLMIIDGRAAFTGGVNLADEYINELERFGRWKDCGILVRGKAVWSMTVMFLSLWGYVDRSQEDAAQFRVDYPDKHGATGFLQQGDVMVFASRGGKTKELLPIVDICKAKGVSIITVTENLESPLAQAADVVLKQHVNRETDKWNAQGTTSTTALCMIFHALQAALIEETGYQAEQFALIHPGGAVGERLNHKAL